MTTACVVNDLRDLTRRCMTDIGFRFPRRADAKVQYIKLGSTAENGRLVIGNERPPEKLSARNLSLKVEIFVLHLFSKSEDTGSGQERLLSYLVCEKPIGTNRQLKGAIKGKMSFPAYCSCRVAKSYLLPATATLKKGFQRQTTYVFLPTETSFRTVRQRLTEFEAQCARQKRHKRTTTPMSFEPRCRFCEKAEWLRNKSCYKKDVSTCM